MVVKNLRKKNRKIQYRCKVVFDFNFIIYNIIKIKRKVGTKIMSAKSIRKPTQIKGIRKLDRGVARVNMKKAGYTQMNKHRSGKSTFASIWRQFV